MHRERETYIAVPFLLYGLWTIFTFPFTWTWLFIKSPNSVRLFLLLMLAVPYTLMADSYRVADCHGEAESYRISLQVKTRQMVFLDYTCPNLTWANLIPYSRPAEPYIFQGVRYE